MGRGLNENGELSAEDAAPSNVAIDPERIRKTRTRSQLAIAMSDINRHQKAVDKLRAAATEAEAEVVRISEKLTETLALRDAARAQYESLTKE